MSDQNWLDDEASIDDQEQIDEYDITSSPNDFNLLTLQSFVEHGAIKIPGFQRNYVWDRTRASKLIESLIIGIPVPQLFLYEEARNKFLVIDGQQRLMTIYYFFKMRFPRKEKRAEIRRIFDQHNLVPDEILQDNLFFEDFRLHFPDLESGKKNRFKGLNYSMLGDYKQQFDLRPLRNIVVRQNTPKDDDSSVYEVFNRLNTGGVNLKPQEIRSSLYSSKFYDMLGKINYLPAWRKFIKVKDPDIHMKDVEVLLRAFAMLESGAEYSPSLGRFLNAFSKKMKKASEEKIQYYYDLFVSFLDSASELPDRAFINERNDRFSVVLFEAVFVATSRNAVVEKRTIIDKLDLAEIRLLASNEAFNNASLEGTTRTDSVKARLTEAKNIVSAR